MNRREFLKICGAACITASCATTKDYFGPDELIAYPELKHDKVQPPSSGCLVGFWKHYKSIGFKLNYATDSSMPIKWFEENIGIRPASLIMYPHINIFGEFPMADAVDAAKLGVIPYLLAEINPDHTKVNSGKKLTEIIDGVYDRGVNDFAKGAVEFGEKYGGFFITTMREANIPSRYSPHMWAEQPENYKQVWRHLWQVFEHAGANKFATWVPSYYAGFSASPYYPGDEYVDWVGLSCYLGPAHQHGFPNLSSLVSGKYNEFKRKKPLMLSELGINKSWHGMSLKKSYQAIESLVNVRAAFYWSVFDFNINESHELAEEGIGIMKNALKNPYFIGANRRNR